MWYVGLKGDPGDTGLPGVKGDPGVLTDLSLSIILYLNLNQFA